VSCRVMLCGVVFVVLWLVLGSLWAGRTRTLLGQEEEAGNIGSLGMAVQTRLDLHAPSHVHQDRQGTLNPSPGYCENSIKLQLPSTQPR